MKNKYAKRARISAAKIREVVHYFAIDLTALQAAALSGLNRNTVNRLYRALRERMLLACEAQRPLFGVVEVDESFFGARRVKGRRGRGAYGKTVVFGIFERHGHVYIEIVSDCSKPNRDEHFAAPRVRKKRFDLGSNTGEMIGELIPYPMKIKFASQKQGSDAGIGISRTVEVST